MEGGGKGFFDDLYATLSSALAASGQVTTISKAFGSLDSDEQRLAFLLNLRLVHDIIGIPQQATIKACKSAKDSCTYREQGNKLYQGKHYEEALLLYNESVAAAPTYRDQSGPVSGNELALALGNRSAVLLHMKYYDLCLADIQQAVECGYPEELQYKLYDRRARCLLQLGKSVEAREDFDRAKKLILKSTLDNKKMAIWMKETADLLEKCRNVTEPTDAKSGVFPPPVAPKLDQVNEKYVHLSDACTVTYTPGQGRYIVANRDIKPGELILKEKPYASVLLPERYSTHCHYCFSRYVAAVPCHACSLAKFCTETCRQMAWSAYHDVECSFLDLLHRSGVGKFGHLALRTVTAAGAEFLGKYQEKLKTDFLLKPKAEQNGISQDGIYKEDDYNAIYNLVTHAQDRPVHDLFRRSCIAVFLLKCLEKGGFMDRFKLQNPVIGESEASSFIAGLLLTHLQMLPCNAHEISEFEFKRESVAASISIEIGAGIYATLSLFNHTCDPAVNRNFYGSMCISRAIKAINKGEEVSDNYGAVYPVHSREERHGILRPQYYFDCACLPCKENWPLYPDIEHTTAKFKCQGCQKPLPKDTGSCTFCKHENNLTEMATQLSASSKQYEVAFARLLAADVEAALPGLLGHLHVMDKMVVRPWREYNNCQEAMKQCYSIQANCFPRNILTSVKRQ